jgi:hypothetical protein
MTLEKVEAGLSSEVRGEALLPWPRPSLRSASVRSVGHVRRQSGNEVQKLELEGFGPGLAQSKVAH